MKHFLILICCLICFAGASQTSDSVVVTTDTVVKKLPKDHRPRNASILSAIIPGAGQIYNGKYWKAPIVWAAMGTLGYYFMQNQKEYSYYRNGLRSMIADSLTTHSETGYDVDQMQTQKIFYRKRRDLFGFGLIAAYAFQIIDANVDAHLKTFDVSDDLSLRVDARPVLVGNAWGAGISLKLNFK